MTVCRDTPILPSHSPILLSQQPIRGYASAAYSDDSLSQVLPAFRAEIAGLACGMANAVQ
jgi:hypothetical protein